MLRPLVILTGALAAGCGAPPDDAAPDATPPDAEPGPCDVAVGAAAVDIDALARELVDELQARGHTGANPTAGGDTFHVHQIRATLDTTGVDPGAAAVAWLASLDAIAFDAAELAPELPVAWDQVDSATLVLLRARVADVDARFARPAASVFLLEEAGTWTVASLSVWPAVALASPDDARALATCTPAAPPDAAAVYATSFEGLRMRGCVPTGTYAYTPSPPDTITWDDRVTWEAIDARWRIVRPAALRVDPVNYWPGIEEADCVCDDEVGFELDADARTAEVLRYRPGIRCVVC